jgi:aspartyl-tRNA(Asn)/glutamyl-tRNA(Gln) amidotransferase subunit A
VFAEVDAILAPTIPEPAPVLADVTAGPVDEIVRRMGRFSRLTRPFNALGLPVVSLPAGAAADGRPLALSIVGRPFDEATVLRLAHACEQAGPARPRLPAPG